MIAGAMAFFARPLVKKLLPWVFGGLFAAILLWVAIGKWNNFKEGLIEQGRVEGRAEVTEQVRKKVAENNRVNREVDSRIKARLDAFADRFEKDRTQRVETENRSERIIERTIVEQPQIFNNPNCAVPQDILDQRNAIRRLGPEENN